MNRGPDELDQPTADDLVPDEDRPERDPDRDADTSPDGDDPEPQAPIAVT